MLAITNTVRELLDQNRITVESASLYLEKMVYKGKNELKQDLLPHIVSSYNTRKETIVDFTNDLPNVRCIPMELKSNLIVNPSVALLENAGVQLDRLHNFPFISGSGFKGAVSHVAYLEWRELALDSSRSENMVAYAEDIAYVFGYPTNHKTLDSFLDENWQKEHNGKKREASRGHVVFFDVIPLDHKPELAIDILTPHQSENPQPLPFLVVKEGATFGFRYLFLDSEGRMSHDVKIDESKKKLLEGWISAAAEDIGMGAKTAAGYGWFGIDEEFLQRREQEAADKMRKQEDARQRQAEKEAEATRKAQEKEAKAAEEEQVKNVLAQQHAAEEQAKKDAKDNPFADVESDKIDELLAGIKKKYPKGLSSNQITKLLSRLEQFTCEDIKASEEVLKKRPFKLSQEQIESIHCSAKEGC